MAKNNVTYIPGVNGQPGEAMPSNQIAREVSTDAGYGILAAPGAPRGRARVVMDWDRLDRIHAQDREAETGMPDPATVLNQRIEQQGQYAVRLVFDDGHDTGIYSWDTLYQLGMQRAENWATYLARLQEMGVERKESGGRRRIKLLYFAYLVQKLRKQSEEIELPERVENVASLLEFLRRRKPEAAPLFADDNLRVTVNRQFAELFTPLASGDEVSLTPVSPVAPATPGLI